jgi:flagellar biosynthesis/type III secretory pathway M-ring protein FliF/YscJ
MPGGEKILSFDDPQVFEESGQHEVMVRIDYTKEDAQGGHINSYNFRSNLFRVTPQPQPSDSVNITQGSDQNTQNSTPDNNSEPQQRLNELIGNILPILLIIAFLIVLAAAVFRLMRREGGPDELEELKLKKKKLQETIELAKHNYYKRRLDEKGLRKTLKDAQDEIFLIDQKIKKLKNKD